MVALPKRYPSRRVQLNSGEFSYDVATFVREWMRGMVATAVVMALPMIRSNPLCVGV